MSKLAFLAIVALTLFGSRSGSTLAVGDTITTLSAYAGDSSLALDADGYPVIAYRDAMDTRLKIMHCNDPYCIGGDESVFSPDPQPGQWPSLVLDASGNPVVSYYTTYYDKLKLLHCSNPNCEGGSTISTPDPGMFRLLYPTSLALDASGNPVIAYAPPYEIRLMHCNDIDCAGGDESITTHDVNVGAPSLALDASGSPVISYYKFAGPLTSTGTLKVLHCNDPGCSGGDETLASPDPATSTASSLRLDGGGRPVIAYYTGSTTKDLKIMHCNDANCGGANESITTPDSTGDVGSSPALVLDNGNPVVTYRDETNGDLKLLRCDDPNCATGGDIIVSLDAVSDSGENSSLVLDGSGDPAVSYDAGADLKLLRCGDTNCSGPKLTPTPTVTPTPTPKNPDGDTDGDGMLNSIDLDDDNDGCPDVDETGPDERSGGRRDPHNPWDYFNPTNDGENRVDDILAVVNHYSLSKGEVGYDDGKYDRSSISETADQPWRLGPPNGRVLVDDILHAVRSYHHDCGSGVVKPTPTPTQAP